MKKTSIISLTLAFAVLFAACNSPVVVFGDAGVGSDGSIADGALGDAGRDGGWFPDGSMPDGGVKDTGPDGDGGVVIKCSDDTECKSLGLYCDKTSGNCVECLQDGTCDMGKLCIDNRCVTGCRDNRDCKAPLFCDPALGEHGTCIECNLQKPCSGDLTCRDNKCVKLCKESTDCTPPLLCDKTTGDCVTCLEDANCDFGKICINKDCVEGCHGDRDCLKPMHCDTNIGNGKCVECTLSEHCPSTAYECIGDVCVFKCKKEEDCAPFSIKPHCKLDTNQCVLCTQNAHCPKGYVCYNSDCLVGCSVTADCTSPKVCDTSSTPGACVDCLTQDDCTSGKKCTTDHKCVECRDGGDCTAPKKFCLGTTSTCVECRDNSDCGTGLTCDPDLHICKSPLMMCDSTQCTSQDQCPQGTLCTNYNGGTTYKCRPTCDMFETCAIYDPFSTCSTSGDQVCSCIGPCKSTQDCLFYLGTWCDTVSGRCISCDQKTKCTNGGVCRYNRCLDCTTDNQCKAEYSDRPWCIVANGTCVQCKAEAECKTPGLTHCSQAGSCVECTEDSHCVSPKTCQSNVCALVKKGACEACSKDSECETGTYCRMPYLDGGTNLKCRIPCDYYYDCEDYPYSGSCAETGYCGCSI